MLRSAAVVRPRHIVISKEYPIPAPVGGLNAKDSIADMPESDALVLDNFFPQPDYVELRRGHEEHATDLGAAIESLMEWSGPTSRKLFGAAGADIFDASSAGAVGAADVTGLNSAQWQHVMTATSGGKFLVACNGADAVQAYDGSSWSEPAITGVSPADLINVAAFKERLFFVEDGTQDFWYLGTQAIAGAATKFPLGAVFKKGGRLLAIGSLTRDGGAGPDDFCAFVSTMGEVAIYQGTDPASASTWALVGVFQIPMPIGLRCLQKAGGDLAVITEGGVISLNAMLVLDRAAQERAAVTSKINRLFMGDARSYRSNAGWQVLTYPRSNMLIVNVPVAEAVQQRQYVMNALTGSWCRFTGLNGGCWTTFNDDLYFGGNDGTVYRADSTYQDDGEGIVADMKTAFKSPGRGHIWSFQQIRTLFSSNGTPGYLLDLNTDYEDRAPTSEPTSVTQPGSRWGVAKWGVDVWGGGETISRSWVGASGNGTVAAVRLRVVSDGATFTVYGFDVIAERGGLQ
jgi:hypothetical protein